MYYVFHVGYSPEHESFMYFLQYAFLGEKKLPRVSVGVSKLVLQFDTALREVKESKGYKDNYVFNNNGHCIMYTCMANGSFIY